MLNFDRAQKRAEGTEDQREVGRQPSTGTSCLLLYDFVSLNIYILESDFMDLHFRVRTYGSMFRSKSLWIYIWESEFMVGTNYGLFCTPY